MSTTGVLVSSLLTRSSWIVVSIPRVSHIASDIDELGMIALVSRLLRLVDTPEAGRAGIGTHCP